MEPVFPTVTVESSLPSRPPASLTASSPMYDRTRPVSEILLSCPPPPPDEDDLDEAAAGVDDVDETDHWSPPAPQLQSSSPQLTSFKPIPPPPPPKPTQEEIDRDVQIILRNMGLDAPTPTRNGNVVVERAVVEATVNGGDPDNNRGRGPVLQTGL